MSYKYQSLKARADMRLAEANEFYAEAEEAKMAEVKSDKTMKSWLGYTFESSSSLTKEYALFAKQMKAYLKRVLPDNLELVDFSQGHFYFSAFVKNNETGKYVYVSCSDVRYWPDGWYNNLLIRTAEHNKDYTGGANDWTTLENLPAKAVKLTQ